LRTEILRVPAPKLRFANRRISRGIGNLTATLAKDADAAKGLLPHTSLATTLGHHVTIVPEVTERAMRQVEQLCSTDENASRR
jgi:hypothetical protein